jgi:hypothetical protein
MDNNHLKNMHAILTELSGSLQKNDDVIDYYFNEFKEGEMLNPFLAGGKINSVGSNEALPPEFFSRFGIRAMVLETPHGRLSLSERNFVDIISKNAGAFTWRDLKSDLIMEDLRMLFANSQIVEFAHWADVENAGDIWDNLRRDIIMPLKRNDFEFIFHMGDAAKKLGFEVDEFLDIISSYELFGRVTLVLDEQNAVRLWDKLSGQDSHFEFSTLPGLNEKCRSLFDLMDVSHLVIDSLSAVLIFSRQNQIEITACKSSGAAKISTKHFDAGYILGLMLKIGISQSIALGLAVSGVYTESGSKPNSKILIYYIEKWIREIESFKPEESEFSTA